MTRAHCVKAAKDYPEHGIQKGETYYWWKFRHGAKQFSKTAPRPSQLTQSPFFSALYDWQDQKNAAPGIVGNTAEEMRDSAQAMIDDLKDGLESLRDETQEKHDNMPDSLQEGSTGELLESRVSSLDDMISELDSIEIPEQEEGQSLEDYQQAFEESLTSALEAIEYQGE